MKRLEYAVKGEGVNPIRFRKEIPDRGQNSDTHTVHSLKVLRVHSCYSISLQHRKGAAREMCINARSISAPSFPSLPTFLHSAQKTTRVGVQV
jgi:hypothetical protein